MLRSFATLRTFHPRRVFFVTFTAALAATQAVGLASPVAAAPLPASPVTSMSSTAHANQSSVAPSQEPGAGAKSVAETTAMTQAQATGEPVEVTDSTTETSQVFANPDGTFTLKSNQRPVRVQQDGAWRPIDTTLRVNTDGSVSPTATDQDVVFSGGGTAPLVTVRHADKALAFTWPTPLPKPAVDGDTATYPGVFPGVDLRVIARADSYSQVLVVHNAEAAANPALAQLRTTVTGTGLNLRVDDAGSLVAADPDGVDVMRGAPPLMWDSQIDDRVGPEPTDIDPGSGRVTPLEVTTAPHTSARSATATSTATLTVTPEPEALTGPDVVYPLYIDPSMGVRKQHWSIITDNGWAPQYDTDVLAQVGFCSGWTGCDGAWRARSYFLMPTGDLQHRNGTQAEIYRAEFYANQVWSADHNCSGGRPTTIRESSSFSSGTNWPGPAGRVVDTEYSNAGGPCPAANLRFDVSSSARITAANSYSVLALALVAADENEPLQWKKFDNNPLLEVDFSFPPNQAVNLRVSNEIRCTGTPITPDARPTIYSTATDNNDPPLNLRLGHEVWNSAHTTMRANTPPPSPDVIASGATGNWRIPTVIGDGAYALRSSAQNIYPGYPGRDKWGPWSTWYPFSIDATPPPTTPTVGAAEDYPRGYWGSPSGAPGLVPVSTPDTDAVGYAYTFNGSGTQTVPNAADCNYYRAFGTGGVSGGWLPNTASPVDWIPIPAGLTAGYHTMHVKTFDNAHNMSAESTAYTFYVAPNTGLSTLKLEAETLPRSQPTGQNSTIAPQSNCCSVTWSGNSQLSFNATAVGQSATVTFTVGAESDYQLALAITKATNYGIASFQLDGTTIGGSFDGYANKVYNTHLPLGTRKLTAGTHTLTVTTTGTNPASSGARYVVGIDYLTLTQTTRHQAERLTTHQPDGQNVPLTREVSTGTGPGPFSEQEQLKFAATGTGQSFSLDFRVPIEADYALGAAFSMWTNYGQVRIDVDGTPLFNTGRRPWDGYASGNGRTTYQPLGGAHLTAGTHTLTITVVGKNTASTGYHVGIDYLTAVAVNNVHATDFTAAMNNDGIGSDNTTPANLDLQGSSLSAQALAAAGYAPGSTVTINGATFTMPAHRSDGMDNVISLGQTIPFPAVQRVRASSVGLLVAAVSTTCGSTPYEGFAKITYTDNTTQDSLIGFGNDWSDSVYGGADVVMPYRNEGTAPNRAVSAGLSAVFAPTDPSKTLASITLPNFGSDLLPGGCAAAQHVFAISPRPVAPGWVGTWSAPVDAAVPPPGGAGFANQTLRSVVHPTVTGDSIRVRLSNRGASTPVTFDSVTLATQTGTAAATTHTPTALTFNSSAAITIPAGAEVLSDPLPYPANAGGSGNLIVSMHVTSAVTSAPIHAYPVTPTFLANGNATTNTTGDPFTTRLSGVHYLSGVHVSTTNTEHGTVAVLGDHLTAIGAPGTDQRRTWVDALPAKLTAAGVPLPGGLVNASRAGLPPAGHWRLDDGNAATANDSAGTANATLTSGATWSSERGGAVALNGSTGCLTTATAVLDTAGSFTVSAWVKLNATSTSPQTVVSQDGTNNNAFALQYTGSADNKWSFTMPATGANGAPAVRVLSSDPVQTGVWTHLVATYDAPGKLAQLFVNQRWQDNAAHSTPWASTGPLAIGRGKANGASTSYLNGLVSDVRAYQVALNEYDISVLYYGSPVPGDQPGGDALRTGWASEALNRTVLNEPSLRTVLVSLGANEILGDFSADTVRTYLAPVMMDIRKSRRTDGSPVHVIVTTVPPLGLASNDPREQARQQFNADLKANYTDSGADDIIDFAAAVSDPASPGNIKPAYLTDGVPNAQYHEAIATAIAEAASKFPPEAQL